MRYIHCTRTAHGQADPNPFPSLQGCETGHPHCSTSSVSCCQIQPRSSSTHVILVIATAAASTAAALLAVSTAAAAVSTVGTASCLGRQQVSHQLPGNGQESSDPGLSHLILAAGSKCCGVEQGRFGRGVTIGSNRTVQRNRLEKCRQKAGGAACQQSYDDFGIKNTIECTGVVPRGVTWRFPVLRGAAPCTLKAAQRASVAAQKPETAVRYVFVSG